MDLAQIQPLLDWIDGNPLLTGLMIFVIAMSESLAVIGFIVPGVIMMFAIGALIATDVLQFWPVFFWAVFGAIAGDGVSYWLGRHFSDRIAGMWPFRKHPRMIEHGEAYIRKHGGKSVLLGRFVGPMRAIVPLVAGMLGMSRLRFFSVNAVSALLWAPAYLIPGIVFGASMELASEVATHLAALIAILVAVLWLVSWVVRRLFQFLQPHGTALLDALLRSTEGHRWMGQLSAAVADPNHPEARGLLMLALLLVAGTWGFAAMLASVMATTPGTGLDLTLHELALGLHTPLANSLMIAVTRLGDLYVIASVGVVVLIWLLLRRDRLGAWHWLAAVMFGLVVGEILKLLLQIPRPEALAGQFPSYSFPSSHVLRSATTYGFLSVLIATGLPVPRRWLAYLAGGLLITLTAVSRLYLGVHWQSDVTASLSLGIAWVCIVGIAYRRHRTPDIRWVPLSVIAVLTIAAALAVGNGLRQQSDMARYSLQPDIESMQMRDWWTHDWRVMPERRDELRNEDRHPLNLQWAGTARDIATTMRSLGWREPVTLDAKSTLLLLNTDATVAELPVLPQVHRGTHPELMFTRNIDDDSQHTIRLWRSTKRLEPEGVPLWIGNISTQSLRSLLTLLAYPRTEPDFDTPLKALHTEMHGTALTVKQVRDGRSLLLRRQPQGRSPGVTSSAR